MASASNNEDFINVSEKGCDEMFVIEDLNEELIGNEFDEVFKDSSQEVNIYWEFYRIKGSQHNMGQI